MKLFVVLILIVLLAILGSSEGKYRLWLVDKFNMSQKEEIVSAVMETSAKPSLHAFEAVRHPSEPSPNGIDDGDSSSPANPARIRLDVQNLEYSP